MIAQLSGRIAAKTASEMILDVSGVGYQVFCSLRTIASLPEVGAPATVRVITIVREDAFLLYGFVEQGEQEAFRLLLSVAGVGPRLALAVLSGLAPEELARAVIDRDLARICAVPGVGKKTAERIAVDLADKAERLMRSGEGEPSRAPSPDALAQAMLQDLIGALVNLGYKAKLAEGVARQLAARAEEGAGLEELVRAALAILAR